MGDLPQFYTTISSVNGWPNSTVKLDEGPWPDSPWIRLLAHSIHTYGAVHKVRHARGGGVREGVTVCDRGRGSRACDVTLLNFFYHKYETWNLKWYLPFCCNKCILIEGGMDKSHPGQNLPDKIPSDKTPRTKTPTNNWENLYRGLLPGFFVLGLLKIGGWSPRCVTYFGGSRDVWQSVTWGEGGSKLTKNRVTYFMNGPYVTDAFYICWMCRHMYRSKSMDSWIPLCARGSIAYVLPLSIVDSSHVGCAFACSVISMDYIV